MSNKTLHKSKKATDNDEYYTLYEDIADELPHYFQQMNGKSVYCNCDNPLESNFVLYLIRHFNIIGLTRLTATCIQTEKGYCFTVQSVPEHITAGTDKDIKEWIESKITHLNGNGSFQSDECLALLNSHDIIVTNPPFSLFRLWYDCIKNAGKKFLVLCNMNTCLTAKISKDIVERQIWFGNLTYNKTFYFKSPQSDETIHMGFVCWLTNMDIKEKPFLPLIPFIKENYEVFDGQNVLKVRKIVNIPDYDGIMGVPTSFLFKHNPRQFRIIGTAHHGSDNEYDLFKPIINGKEQYQCILIQKVKD